MEIFIEEATINDIDEIVKLKKNIYDKLENKELYVIDGTNQDYLKDKIENNEIVLKAINSDKKIVGFLIMSTNVKKEEDIIKKVHLEEKINICIELVNTAVDSDYRGNNLLIKMIKKAEEMIKDKYHKKYILTTVHPNNLASLHSFLEMEYEIKCKSKMYGNLDRYILIKELDE